jgi:hypothetical protein
MAFLTGTEYITISNLISSARIQMQDSVGDIFDAVYEIVQMDNIDKEIDLLSPFFGVYQVSNDSWKQTSTLDAGVRALNNHVLRRSSHSTLDEYLSSEGVQVTQTYADLSNSLGFPIVDGGNIA